MMTAIRVLLGAISLIALILTLLPIADSNNAYIRIWDFPRPQILALLFIGVLLIPVAFDHTRRRIWLVVLVLLMAAFYQGWRIWPYTPLHSVQAEAADRCAKGTDFKILTANVLIDNRDSGLLLDLIDIHNPDIVLLVETDRWWADQMASLDDTYPHRLLEPLDNSYGMLLYSKLPLIEPQIRYLVEPNVPSMLTGVWLRSGKEIRLYGLHPRPPPKHRTANRDAEILIVGKEVSNASDSARVIVAGDLNDVAWSDTTRLFQEISGLLDPRIGRGLYATFNANWPLLRWPLDHVFYSDEFLLNRIEVQPYIGSDHFPFFIEVCLKESASVRQDEPHAEAEDRQEARKAIRKGLEPDKGAAIQEK